MASLTGATYLFQHTLSTAPSLFDLNTNWFVPGDAQLDAGRCVAQAVPASQAFHGRNAWQPALSVSKTRGKGSAISSPPCWV